MTTPPQQMTQKLVAALTDAQINFEAQRQSAEESRRQAEVTHHRFMSLMTEFKTQGNSERFANLKQAMDAAMLEKSSLGERANSRLDITTLSRQWNVLLADAQDALMRLYAFPLAQSSAEKIAVCLREIRLMGHEEISESPPAFVLPPPLPDNPPPTLLERKQHQAGMALDLVGGMDGYMAKVQENAEMQFRRTRELLHQARQEAESLLALTQNSVELP